MEDQKVRAAIYARVSSEQQAQQNTIASQVEALRERVAADGWVLDEELCFIDDGYSGSTLQRPALERLRDVAHASGLQRLYVLAPDRLARKYAYQVLLVEELRRVGVELVFLNQKLGVSAEEDLLLQMQGMIAEYERANIIERSRRGKRHAARRGLVNVLSGAPYGYRYVGKHEGSGQAYYQVVFEEAQAVRQVFEWIGRDRLSLGEVCRRLKRQGIVTRTGKNFWNRTTIWGMLNNPAYKGMAAFGKTRLGELRPRLRPQRGRSLQPLLAHGPHRGNSNGASRSTRLSFGTWGSVAPHRGRNVRPPELALPGPFVTARHRAALAAYLSEESSSNAFWTGTDPPR